ncbi:MAG: GTPase HflX [Solirubrobacterales bacterium]|nr:GTPase HflX [Solirubrobacterales bacterium]
MIAVDQTGGASLAELGELLRTAGVATVGEVMQRRSEPDPDRYFGQGKLEEVKEEVKRTGANLVACDDELAPRQERNLEASLGVPVIDRTAVILDIFADHAHSAEGKLQVELAQLEYNLARMRGLWTHLERLGAGIGTRGPGESQIETDRRLARDRIAALRRRLRHVEQNRGVMRARRQDSSLPQVALAGYTNAGKSTLLNALTGAEVSVGNRLFHTLDPTTRGFEFESRRYLVTDTVGFIEKLPHQLVEAFKATLEETVLADLILHVVDGSAGEERMQAEMAAADSVLDEIGAGDKPRLLVLNKIDLLDREQRSEARIGHPEGIQVSAVTGEGLDALRKGMERAFEETMTPVELLVPYSEGARLHELHEVAGKVDREDGPEGVLVRTRLPLGEVHRFADLATQ